MARPVSGDINHGIVLVEDSEAVRRSLTLLLRTNGYSVEAFETGIELLSSKFLPSPSCFLIDFQMPKLDGLQLLKRLRASGAQAPALMITGDVTLNLRRAALASGFFDLIEKPPARDALIERLEAAISAA